MLNKVILNATLTRNIELRYSSGGSAIANMGVACNQKWKDKNTGEQREDVLFIDCVIFGRSGETANQYLKKGSKVLIEGQLQFQQWEDQNGNKRSKHIIKVDKYDFLDSKSNNGEVNKQSYENNQQQNSYQQSNNGEANVNDFNEDEHEDIL